MATEKANVGDTPEVEAVYPLSHHLGDLRKRIVYSLIAIVIMFCLSYWQSQFIFDFITAPIKPFIAASATTELTTLRLTEGFFAELKLSLLSGVIFAMPFILFQFWKFVAPGLYRNERRYVVGFVFSATFLFILGASFVYYIVFPMGFKFFLSINDRFGMIATLSIEWYISFVIKLLVAFGLAFELPVVIFFLSRIGIVNPAMLRKYRKFAILGIFIFATIITPPDVISQIMLAMPMLLLYEIGIWISGISSRKKASVESEKEADIYE